MERTLKKKKVSFRTLFGDTVDLLIVVVTVAVLSFLFVDKVLENRWTERIFFDKPVSQKQKVEKAKQKYVKGYGL